jgi:predicted DNA-binding protein with PD1-like motif
MKKFLLFFLSSFFFVIAGYTQEKFPDDVHVVTTEFKRIEIIRMRTGTDLLEGLNKAIENQKIKNAVILAGIGSVTDYHFHVVSDKNLPPGEEFPKASVAKDLIAVQGYIFDGRVHAHITLSDENSVIGGHLEPGTKALTFFILTIGVLPDNADVKNLDNYKY